MSNGDNTAAEPVPATLPQATLPTQQVPQAPTGQRLSVKVKSPDGKSVRLFPEGTTREQAAAAFKSGAASQYPEVKPMIPPPNTLIPEPTFGPTAQPKGGKRITIKGPDGQWYTAPAGTTRQQAMDYFNRAQPGVMTRPGVPKPTTGAAKLMQPTEFQRGVAASFGQKEEPTIGDALAAIGRGLASPLTATWQDYATEFRKGGWHAAAAVPGLVLAPLDVLANVPIQIAGGIEGMAAGIEKQVIPALEQGHYAYAGGYFTGQLGQLGLMKAGGEVIADVGGKAAVRAARATAPVLGRYAARMAQAASGTSPDPDALTKEEKLRSGRAYAETKQVSTKGKQANAILLHVADLTQSVADRLGRAQAAGKTGELQSGLDRAVQIAKQSYMNNPRLVDQITAWGKRQSSMAGPPDAKGNATTVPRDMTRATPWELSQDLDRLDRQARRLIGKDGKPKANTEHLELANRIYRAWVRGELGRTAGADVVTDKSKINDLNRNAAGAQAVAAKNWFGNQRSMHSLYSSFGTLGLALVLNQMFDFRWIQSVAPILGMKYVWDTTLARTTRMALAQWGSERLSGQQPTGASGGDPPLARPYQRPQLTGYGPGGPPRTGYPPTAQTIPLDELPEHEEQFESGVYPRYEHPVTGGGEKTGPRQRRTPGAVPGEGETGRPRYGDLPKITQKQANAYKTARIALGRKANPADVADLTESLLAMHGLQEQLGFQPGAADAPTGQDLVNRAYDKLRTYGPEGEKVVKAAKQDVKANGWSGPEQHAALLEILGFYQEHPPEQAPPPPPGETSKEERSVANKKLRAMTDRYKELLSKRTMTEGEHGEANKLREQIRGFEGLSEQRMLGINAWMDKVEQDYRAATQDIIDKMFKKPPEK